MVKLGTSEESLHCSSATVYAQTNVMNLFDLSQKQHEGTRQRNSGARDRSCSGAVAQYCTRATDGFASNDLPRCNSMGIGYERFWQTSCLQNFESKSYFSKIITIPTNPLIGRIPRHSLNAPWKYAKQQMTLTSKC